MKGYSPRGMLMALFRGRPKDWKGSGDRSKIEEYDVTVINPVNTIVLFQNEENVSGNTVVNALFREIMHFNWSKSKDNFSLRVPWTLQKDPNSGEPERICQNLGHATKWQSIFKETLLYY